MLGLLREIDNVRRGEEQSRILANTKAFKGVQETEVI